MENMQEHPGKLFGLIGRHISYSFSRSYFNKKFHALQRSDHRYINFDIASIEDFPAVLKKYPNLKGLNVTIPYKEEILPYIHELSEEALEINAVNTIKFTKSGLKGYNTDCYGFRKSFAPLVKPHHKNALVLGTGGASKAIVYVLKKLGIDYRFVSRNQPGTLRYADVNKEIITQYNIIINCTPLGTAPEVTARPKLPYKHISPEHLLYDLVYNPAETAFLASGKARGATICNGLSMLKFQAEKAWHLWNS